MTLIRKCVSLFFLLSIVIRCWSILGSTELNAQNIYYYHGWNARIPYGIGFVFSNHLPMRYWQNSSWNGFSFWLNYNSLPHYIRFGAISYSPQRDVAGYATGFATRELATRASQYYCGSTDCQPIAWVQGGCLALAKELQTGRLNWAYHLRMESAKILALNICQNNSSYNRAELPEEFSEMFFPQCELRSWVCS